MKRLDITGKQYGGIIPQKCYPQYKGDHTYWDCYCTICGGNKLMPLDSIKKKPVSCGCVKEDLTGNVYGQLRITRMLPKEGKVECLCVKCGGIEKHGIYYVKLMTQCSTCTKKELGGKISESLANSKFYRNGTSLASWAEERKINKNNTSGRRGVSYDKARDSWRAYIKYQGQDIHIGRFLTLEDAVQARDAVENDIKLQLRLRR